MSIRIILFLLLLFSLSTTGAEAAGECLQWQDINIQFNVDYNLNVGNATLARNFSLTILEGLEKQGRLSRAGGIAFPYAWDGSKLTYLWSYDVSAANRNSVINAIKATAPWSGLSGLPLYNMGNGLMFSIIDGANHLKTLAVPGQKYLIVVSGGDDNSNWSGMAAYQQAIQNAASALKNSTASNYLFYTGIGLPYYDPSGSTLYKIAQASGSQFRTTTLGNANTLLNEILAKGCTNHRPTVALSLSTNHLRLGIDGFSIQFDGSSSNDKETSNANLKFEWTFTRPDQSTYTRTGIKLTETFDDSQLKHGESWKVQLKVTDTNGSSDTSSTTFKVSGSPPKITLTGNSIDVLQTLTLSASPANDIDGGPLKFTWRVVSSPPKASFPLNHTWNTQNVSFQTKEGDIGNWTFECIAEDNEGDKDPKQISLEVRNLPPVIKFAGQKEIDIGQTIKVETQVLDDKDGGPLTFQWDIIQAPKGATPNVKAGYFAGSGALGSGIVITTLKDNKYAGTWIFKLTASDNDNAKNSTVSEEFAVIVDAPPHAIIKGPSRIGTLSFPLELDGRGSLDPDSPPKTPTDPQQGCNTLGNVPVKQISDGIVAYTWSLIDVLIDQGGLVPTGRVDEVFKVPAFDQMLKLDFGYLKPGDWTFQLEVHDAEGNDDFATHQVSVVDENGPPTAAISPPARYTTDAFGKLSEPITLSGYQSFDLDDLLIPGTDMVTPGLGITQYAWQVLSTPPGCTAPTLLSGPNAHTVTLYQAGTGVPATCQGQWHIRLTVTDNDTPAKTDSAQTDVIIGNCPKPLCIDYPTKANPQLVELKENTDVLIYYHLDSALYGAWTPMFGLFTHMDVFHQSDLNAPVYTSTDSNLLASNKGGMLVLHWNGYTNAGQHPKEGKYTVRINLLDHLLKTTAHVAEESEAIWIQVAEPTILPTSDKYVSHDKLDKGTGKISLSYKVEGGAKPDELRWRVRDVATGLPVHEAKLVPSPAGTISWDGKIAGKTISTGSYAVEMETYKAGSSMGKSLPHDLVIYRLALSTSTGPASASPPGLFVFVNSDDDDRDNKSDLTETAPFEDDMVEIKIALEPALQATATLSSTDASPPFKLWDAPTKGKQTTLPVTYKTPAETVPPKFFVEGQSTGQSNLSLNVVTHDGVTLEPVKMALTTTEVQVVIDQNNSHTVTSSDPTTYHLRIARWDQAYIAGVNVRNNADPNNFVELDPSRFYLRVRDPSANTNPVTQDVINVQLGTLKGVGGFDDDLTNIPLTETGANTAEFVSRSQLLTSADIPATADDNYQAHDGSAGPVADDTPGDRTHRTEVDGYVRVQYQPAALAAAATKTWDVPVCQRAPEARRRAPLIIYVFNEPYEDVGLDGVAGTKDTGEGDGMFTLTDTNMNGIHDAGEPSEPYIDLSHGGTAPPLSGAAVGVANGRSPIMTNAQVAEQMQRADIAWAQACISTKLSGAIQVVDAPRVGGTDILLDGTVNLPADATSIYSAYSATMGTDRTYVFFAAPMAGANAIAFPPNNPQIAHGEHSFVLMAPNLDIRFRTLAHELGHIFTNSPDGLEDPPIFFPQTMPVHAGYNDSNVTMRRRISQVTETNARSVRPAGNTGAVGNSVLTTP